MAMRRFNCDDSILFDPVIAKISNDIADAEPIVADLVELMLYRLWLQQSLKSDHTNDSLGAALLRATQLDESISDYDELAPAFSKQIDKWDQDAISVEERIEDICQRKDNTKKSAKTYLLMKIAKHNKQVHKDDKQFANLIICLYDIESQAIYDTATIAAAEFNPAIHFQVHVVTWLKLCGGLPKVTETHNVGRTTTSFLDFLVFLTMRTKNVQISELGFPEGLALRHGAWLYRVVVDEMVMQETKLASDADFVQMVEDAVSMGQDGKVVVIHEAMARVPLVIQARQARLDELDEQDNLEEEDEDEDEQDEPIPYSTTGLRYGPLPPGFTVGMVEGVVLDLSQHRALLSQARYSERVPEAAPANVKKKGRSQEAAKRRKKAQKEKRKRQKASGTAKGVELAIRPADASAVGGQQPPPPQQPLRQFLELPIRTADGGSGGKSAVE